MTRTYDVDPVDPHDLVAEVGRPTDEIEVVGSAILEIVPDSSVELIGAVDANGVPVRVQRAKGRTAPSGRQIFGIERSYRTGAPPGTAPVHARVFVAAGAAFGRGAVVRLACRATHLYRLSDSVRATWKAAS